MTDVKSYRPMVLVSDEWVGNALRFPTKEEAQDNADNLKGKWFAVMETRVDPSDEEPNYRWGGPDKGLITIEK
jgi:hypothetical protein